MGYRWRGFSSKLSLFVVVTLFYFPLFTLLAKRHDEQTILLYKNKVKQMFDHAYQGYMEHAFPLDELRPLTCDGQDTWGSYSLTLIDSLDTLVILGNHTEFRRAVEMLLKTLDFDRDLNVSVFETNIRVVGGLLSAHLLSKKAGLQLEEGWPCSGPLLRLAEKVARKLLPAFDTPTGMPYGTINLLYGVPKGETPVTCTAGVGTFVVEFGALTQLTGATVFMEKALRALQSLWFHKSSLGLVGNHIDVATGKWTALDSTIGAGVDSYFEYLVKGAMLFGYPDLMKMFVDYKGAIEKHLKKDDWYLWAHMEKGSITNPLFQSLEAFWPGLLSLTGDLDSAMKSLHNYHQIWRQYGFIPEFYNIPKAEAQPQREGYPLRPELVESIMYLYRATRDPSLIDMAIDVVETIEYSCRTPCGYATVKNVKDHSLDNRMESFFLAETLKYLYLIFDEDNFIHNDGSTHSSIMTTRGKCFIDAGGYVFNTEAHPIDASILYCCSHERQEDLDEMRAMTSFVDLTRFVDLGEEEDVDDYALVDTDLDFLMMKARQASESNNNDDDKNVKETSIKLDVDDAEVADVEVNRSNPEDSSSSSSSSSPSTKAERASSDVCSVKSPFLMESSPVCLKSQERDGDDDDVGITSAISKLLGKFSSGGTSNSTRGERVGSLCPVSDGELPHLRFESRDSQVRGQTTYKVKRRAYSTSMHELLTCEARPFHARFSIMGQMFDDDDDE